MKELRDIRGKNISRETLERSLNTSILAGFLGIYWFITCQPQQILTVFLGTYLGASSRFLGIFVSIFQAATVFHLGSVWFYSRLTHKKPFWIITAVLQRCTAFAIAGAAFFAAGGGDRTAAMLIVLAAGVASSIAGSVSASGWWDWMTDLVPSATRGTFFGRRSAWGQAANVLFFFLINLILDRGAEKIFLIYGGIYLLSGIMGSLDILLHLSIPEPEHDPPKAFSLNRFLEPLRNPPFLRFCLVMGLSLTAYNVTNPFIAAYLTNPARIGAPNLWVGIMGTVSQGIWILVIPYWGIIMDRLGKKPVVVIGSLGTLGWLFMIPMNPGNFPGLVLATAGVNGLLFSGYFEGLSQMMLSLVPRKNRTPYIAWYWTFFGLYSALGPILGGQLIDWADRVPLLPGLNGFKTALIVSNLAVLAGLPLFRWVTLSHEHPVKTVLAAIANPGMLRTFSYMGVIGRSNRFEEVEKALRKVEGQPGNMASTEVIGRLDDPDPDLREEAARALGRLGTPEAVEALCRRLSDPASTIRIAAARALGRIGSREAIPFLIDALAGPSEDLQEAAADALGRIDDPVSAQALYDLINTNPSERVRATSADALSRQRITHAFYDIFRVREESANPVLRKQMLIALANMTGPPGEFYRLITNPRTDSSRTLLTLLTQVEKKLFHRPESPGKWKKSPFMERHVRDELLPELRKCLQNRDYRGGLELLHRILLNAAYLYLRDSGKVPESAEGEELLQNNPLLHMGFWLISRLWDRCAADPPGEPEPEELILCLFFLRHYEAAD